MPIARLLGTRLRTLAGGVEIPLSGETVRDALDALVAQAPDADKAAEMSALLYGEPGGELTRDARVLKNGQNVLRLDGLGTPLGEHDTLSIYFFGSRAYPGG